jgi:transcription antitermination factor NusB
MAVGKMSAGEALGAVQEADGEPGPFTDRILALLEGREEEWDSCFEPCLAEGWPLSRLSWTDRVILRLACCELWGLPDVPPRVTIAEYVGLSKRFGSPEGSKFVNGVLACALTRSPKADWSPTDAPEPDPLEGREVEERTVIEEESSPWVIRSEA